MGEIATEKKRDALFDNIRAFLIFSVVLLHLLNAQASKLELIREIYYGINMYVMPAFVFITGYFSKNVEKSRDRAVRDFLIPYLVFNTLYAVMIFFREPQEVNFFDFYRVTKPQWGMWFLLACFIWKVLAKDLIRLRAAVPAALLMGLGVPFFRDFTVTFTIGRVFGFLVFFVAGLKFRPEWLEKLRRIPAWAGGIVFAAGFLLSMWLGQKGGWMVKETLYLRSPYEDEVKVEQMLMRLVFYLIGFIMTLALFVMFTRKQCFLSEIGQNTLTVYILHLFIVDNVKELGLLKGQPYWYLFFSILLAAALTWLLSRKQVRQAYNFVFAKINNICFRNEE